MNFRLRNNPQVNHRCLLKKMRTREKRAALFRNFRECVRKGLKRVENVRFPERVQRPSMESSRLVLSCRKGCETVLHWLDSSAYRRADSVRVRNSHNYRNRKCTISRRKNASQRCRHGEHETCVRFFECLDRGGVNFWRATEV